MFLKKALVSAVFLLAAIPVAAAEESRIYVIKKGDTLWGISDRFIKDPYYWPNLWANNPDIPNPHFIYPGQKLRIFPDRIEIVTAEDEIGQIIEQPQEQPSSQPVPTEETPVPAETITIKTPAGQEGFIDKSAIGYVGTLVDTTDNRIMMGEGDKVFVQLTDSARVTPGDRFTLFTLGEKVHHPSTGEFLGYFVREDGTVQITQLHDEVASGVITDADREIQRGAYLKPYQPPRMEIELQEASEKLTGEIIRSRQENIALGQYMVAYIDIGQEEGLLPGNVLIISRPRQATEIAEEDRGLWAEPLQLPEVVLGSAVVLEVQPHTASVLILKSVQPIYAGDRVHTEMR